MFRWLCNSNLNNVYPDPVWPYRTYRENSEYSSPIRSADQRPPSWREFKQPENYKLSRYSWILINFVFEIWQQHHIIWVVDTICFLLLFHKILLAPLLRYSLLVTYCVKIYEIITREPYCDGAARGSPGCPALVFPDHREHQVQTQWAGGAWYYYGIIMTLTHYKVNTSSVQQGCQAV